jgi:hypothetical protein
LCQPQTASTGEEAEEEAVVEAEGDDRLLNAGAGAAVGEQQWVEVPVGEEALP